MARPRCSMPDCVKLVYERGLCRMHYGRWQRHRDPLFTKNPYWRDPLGKLLNSFEVADNGCWEWSAGRNPAGYGLMTGAGGKLWLAHRWAHTFWIGPIPERWEVDHECHNQDLGCRGGPGCRHRACVNPDHLTAKPKARNIAAAGRKNRNRTTCAAGHPYTQENLFYYGDRSKGCLICTPRLPGSARMAEWVLVPRFPKS